MKIYKVWKNNRVIETPYPGKYAGIVTTNKFGRLDCHSGKRANKENRIFFHFWEDAVEAGFEPCKNCKPKPTFTRGACNHKPLGSEAGMILEENEEGELACVLCENLVGNVK